jgi:Tol biopolymer transport system component
VNPAGHTLWSAQADGRSGGWSAGGLLAIPESHGVRVYDESGHRRFKVGLPRQVSVPETSWSPDGAHLAIQWGNSRDRLEVSSADGRLELQQRIGPSGPMTWASDSRLVLGNTGRCRCRASGIDLRTGKSSPASLRWLDPLSPNRKLAIVTLKSGSGFSLGVARPSAGRPKAYALVSGCFDDGVRTPAAGSLQFAGPSRSLVYQSWTACDPPFSNLYSIAPDGHDVQRPTSADAQETQPAISPTGSQIAYVWADATGLSCKGCSDGIRIVNTDGTGGRTLTDPEDCTFDDSPTWSPDGSTILYSETGCDSPGELFTVPAAGGPVHDLGVAGSQPAWGPSRIAYVAADGLWTANPDGSDPIKTAVNGKSPAWSADGRLAYLVGSTGKTVVVGSNETQLPFGLVRSLAWSPDGTRFVVSARAIHGAAYDVYTVNTDGTDPVRLTWNYDASGVSWR